MTEVRNRILWVALQPVSYFIVCRDNSFYVVLFMVCLFYGVFMWVDDANGICSIVHGWYVCHDFPIFAMDNWGKF